MSLSQDFLDEVRARTHLSALITKSVRLKKAGNEWQACCPFHNEKTASFYVNDDKQFYHCFGCGAHGDAIRWLTEHDGLDFLDAVRQLAETCGLEMPARDERPVDPRSVGLQDAVSAAAEWLVDQLRGPGGEQARAYLAQRGVDDETARAFGIGFAPESRSQMRQALGRFGDGMLIEAGLLARPDDGRDPYDRFRNRLTFTIRNPKGVPIAFSGRILGQGEPKYLNSPETALFDKGRTLFNLDRAAAPARKAGRILVVEGQMDVVGLTQVGLAETVAPLGSALTEAQIGLLWRLVSIPTLCFDGDAAGRKASARAAIKAMPGLRPGRSLAFVMMPHGQDPHDLARAGGARAVEEHIARAIPLVDMVWRWEHDAQPLKTPEARAALRERLVAHARTIEHADVARDYENEFRSRVDALFERARFQRYKPAPRATRPPFDPGASERMTITAVLRGLARYPDVAKAEWERLDLLPMVTEAQREARRILLDAQTSGRIVAPQEIDALFPEDRGWQGFMLYFLRPNAYAPRAAADLQFAIDMLIAVQDGVPQEELVAFRRAYKPPKEPEREEQWMIGRRLL